MNRNVKIVFLMIGFVCFMVSANLYLENSNKINQTVTVEVTESGGFEIVNVGNSINPAWYLITSICGLLLMTGTALKREPTPDA